MVRGVYWNIKFVSQPWWCIFSRCLTHVLGRVPLHQPPIMFSSWVWVEPWSTRRRKPETSIPVHWSTQKQTKCENLPSKHCYHCRVQVQTSQTLPVTLSRSALEGIQIHGLLSDMDKGLYSEPMSSTEVRKRKKMPRHDFPCFFS